MSKLIPIAEIDTLTKEYQDNIFAMPTPKIKELRAAYEAFLKFKTEQERGISHTEKWEGYMSDFSWRLPIMDSLIKYW